MKGDFSNWRFDDRTNRQSVLHQQGRVLTDFDWNQQARLSERWRDQAARAAFGRHVAAVSEAWKDSLLVSKATNAAGTVAIEINPGQVWADGWLTYLRDSETQNGVERRVVEHLQGPQGAAVASAGTRDAVVLEVWREALNAFQVPQDLLEPALGGVDTTERVLHGLSFELVRMTADEDCQELAARIQDDLAARGRLSVGLEPSTTSAGPCPVVVGGGYSGFEHNLYRVEVAQVDAAASAFKWSQFNGGLVGRARFDAITKKAKILANRQPILRSGLQSFYVEVFEPVPVRPPQPATGNAKRTAEQAEEWRLIYGGDASLASDEEIDLIQDRFKNIPTGDFFFRIWNELRPLSDFQASPAVELRDGIHLRFTGGGQYRPSDYWTFPVRAGEVATSEPLIDNQPPEGVERVRVPLAVLNWTGNSEITRAAKEIEDCRKVFPPLTDLPPGCCLTLAPGQDLHAAIKKIKKIGAGCICLLPGEHLLDKPIDLTGASNIRFEGFGTASQLVFESAGVSSPVFNLTRSSGISFHSFMISNRDETSVFFCSATRDLTIEGMFLISPFLSKQAPTVSVADTTSGGWRIEDSVFLSSIGVAGLRLSHTRVSGNIFIGSLLGLGMSDFFDVQVERNRFLGIPAGVGSGVGSSLFSGAAGGASAGPGLLDFLTGSADAATGAVASGVSDLELAFRRAATTRYQAARVSGFLDSTFSDNRILARACLSAELVENGSVCRNRMLVTTQGAGFGLARNLDFSGNRIGEARLGQSAHFSPRVGLQILMDAIDCRITDNSFLDVNEAIVFESDLGGGKDVLREFEASVKAAPDAGADEIVAFLENAEEAVEGHRAETRVLSSSYFSVGECARVLIEGNHIEADAVGIEWSGTKKIVDFRISRNSFSGCGNGAILIEPDDRIFFLAEGVDTKVRLIERNRFDIQGVAVRSTIGAVRVARNDIRIRSARTGFLGAGKYLEAVEGSVLKHAEFNEAHKKEDTGNMRLFAKAAMVAAGAEANGIDTDAFHEKVEGNVLASKDLYAGDPLADHLNLISKLALAGNAPLMILGFGAYFRPLVTSLEGFAVNLAGIQNEVVDNNLLSDSSEFDGGVVLQLASGVVSGNEVQVGRFGVVANSKAGQSRDSLRIEGNRLRVTGPAKGDGKRLAAYALAIPSLTAGNYAILDNEFDGSVMVGAEPFASSGLVQKEKLDLPKIFKYHHALAMGEAGYAKSIVTKDVAAKEAGATFIEAALLEGLLVGHFFELFSNDPNKNRAVIQFSDNRVIRGYVALARSTGGAFWSRETLKSQSASAPIIEVTGNVFDYWARVVGLHLILVGNHSQTPLFFRGNKVEHTANIPAAASF